MQSLAPDELLVGEAKADSVDPNARSVGLGNGVGDEGGVGGTGVLVGAAAWVSAIMVAAAAMADAWTCAASIVGAGAAQALNIKAMAARNTAGFMRGCFSVEV